MAKVEAGDSESSVRDMRSIAPVQTVGSDDGAILWWSGILGRTRGKPLLAALQAGGTALAVAASTVLADLMRYGLSSDLVGADFSSLALSAKFQPYLAFMLVAMVVYPLILHGLGLYRYSGSNVEPFRQAPLIAKGLVLGTLVMAAVSTVFLPESATSTSLGSILYLLYFGALAFFSVLLWHSATLIGVLALQSFGVGLRRVALIHAGPPPSSLLEAMLAPSSAYRLTGGIMCGEAATTTDTARLPSLGSIHELPAIINEHNLDEVVLVLDPALLTTEQRLEVAQTCWHLGVELKMVAPFYPFFHTGSSPETVGDVSLLSVEKVGLYARWPQVLKRAMDIAVSALVLFAVSPILLTLMLAIRLDSAGPAFFMQTRVGLNGRTFRMLKLRSMRSDADPRVHQEYLQKLIKESHADAVDASGNAVYKLVDDPRITRIGKFIRKSSLDELPQLLNVLRGEMSLVGPRPPLPYEVAEYEGWHFRRLNIRPGMTGLWQVSGRSQLTYDQMIRLDIDYIENWSLWLDVKILLKTIPAVLKTAQSY